ncbi:MAG: LysR substrate-binding domain-containing protein, partial [Kiloniellales bacterium]|nr:LysR substrate-binding domain-containing protein [Kiloniellales bacterium]
FDAMDDATRRLKLREEGALRISVLPSVAAKWLMPRLPRFRERHPGVDVLISASDLLVDFGREDFHMGLRFGWGRYPGLHVTRLMGDLVFPVCAPRLLKEGPPLKKPQDLKMHTLLHDDMARRDESANDWSSWFATAGVTGIDPYRGPAFSHSSLVLTAAIDGQGVALGRLVLAADDLAAGRLVCPFGPVVASEMSYYLVSPPTLAEQPLVTLFRNWLLEEATDTQERKVDIPAH